MSETPKIRVIVNVGLLLRRIGERHWTGFSQAAAHCQTSISNFHKLSRGELPRLDALQRICKGCGIREDELIIGTTHRNKPGESATVVEMKKTLTA
jgi:hypothetical protein